MVRKVRTEAGARYYGVPIGSVITPDKADEAEARHGGRPAPPGAVTGTDQKRAGQESTEDKQQSGKTEKTDKAAKFRESKLSGPTVVRVGSKVYNVPEGSKVEKSKKHSGRVYVATPQGTGHVFTSKGELELTPEDSAQLAKELGVTNKTEEPEKDGSASWARLVSITRQIEQAATIGDDSAVRRLLQEFRKESAAYDPETDSREVRTKVKKATGS